MSKEDMINRVLAGVAYEAENPDRVFVLDDPLTNPEAMYRRHALVTINEDSQPTLEVFFADEGRFKRVVDFVVQLIHEDDAEATAPAGGNH